ncbi:MAG: hypothetical protein M1833_006508 [Piccolia ochrophora]|nr:MAG: hypothetical protein M1833_006508 [Piccolia ochrophora]
MEVQLYVYDLSKGMARQFSDGFLGTHIDAVYHTSVVFGSVEYYFGMGIQTSRPGATHHGPPMEVITMGTTSLPEDVILQYLDSLREIYTAQSYDLFMHNCNNFSNDFCTFLVGKGIPGHITSLPQTVLNTPFGQMLRPQLEGAMRSVTQAPTPQSSALLARNALTTPKSVSANGVNGANGVAKTPSARPTGVVHNVTNIHEFDRLLESAKKTCAVIFFTSATCPPCKMVYPAYDELAVEVGYDGVLMKVDVGKAYEIGSRYSIRATPTFITFLHGEKENQWTGANERQLRGNVRMLAQMARHPHTKLDLPTLSGTSSKPVTYEKVPPLDKLIAKMGDAGRDPVVEAMKHFVAGRNHAGETTLPDLISFNTFFQSSVHKLPRELLFTVVDLLRVAMMDPRLSGYYAEEADHKTIITLLDTVNAGAVQDCPYSLRLVTLQLACNLFTSPLFPPQIMHTPSLSMPIIQLLTASLLDDQHANVRVAATSLAFNLVTANYTHRTTAREEALSSDDQVELCASLLEAISVEDASPEAFSGLLFSLGFLLYCSPADSELRDLVKAMDAKGTVVGKAKTFPKEGLVREVGGELLTKGT